MTGLVTVLVAEAGAVLLLGLLVSIALGRRRRSAAARRHTQSAQHGNRPGCERQLETAQRRLAAYAPAHRGVDVASLLRQIEAARVAVAAGDRVAVAAGDLSLAPVRV